MIINMHAHYICCVFYRARNNYPQPSFVNQKTLCSQLSKL